MKITGKFLWADPPIFYGTNFTGKKDHEIANLDELESKFIDDILYLLIPLWWSREWYSLDSENILTSEIKSWIAARHERFPKHHYVYCCNSLVELHQFQLAGIDAIICNHNTFSDPDLYKPLNISKAYPAVYNAQFVSWKRHYLAAKTKTLLLAHSIDQDCFRNVILPNIDKNFTIANPINHNQETDIYSLAGIPWESLNKCLNSASVGLSLSALEGANYSSIEYLLAGLSVVTTVNRGGRDFFFDGRFVLTVEPEDYFVREAVYALSKYNNPALVRLETLNKLDYALSLFFKSLERIVFHENKKIVSFEKLWPYIKVHKMHVDKEVNDHLADYFFLNDVKDQFTQSTRYIL